MFKQDDLVLQTATLPPSGDAMQCMGSVSEWATCIMATPEACDAVGGVRDRILPCRSVTICSHVQVYGSTEVAFCATGTEAKRKENRLNIPLPVLAFQMHF